MGWQDVGKKRTEADKTFLRIAKDGKVIIRMLDAEPVTIRQHKIGQDRGGEHLFVSINCSGENCFVCERAKNRYPPQDVWAANVLVLSGLEDQKEPVIRVLVGGPQIWGTMKTLFDSYGDVRTFDVQISKEGENRDTKYTVTASPKSMKIDVAKTVRDRKNELFDMDQVFQTYGPDEQKRMIEEAKIDIDYDAVFERMRTMTLEEAMKTKIGFGKKKGKTIRDVFIEDPKYLSWMAVNVTTSVDIGAAARLVVEHGTKKEHPKTGYVDSAAPKKKPSSANKNISAAAPSTKLDRIRAHLSTKEPYASDVQATAELISKFGKGKKRLDQFPDEAIEALAKHLKVK